MSVINKTLKELNKRTSSSDHGVYVGPGKKSNNVGVIRLVLLILLVCSSCVFTYILFSGFNANAPAKLKQLVVLPVPPFNVPNAIDFILSPYLY